MPNNITLVEKMLPLIDEVYRAEAKSSILDAPSEFVRETKDAKTIQIAKLHMIGLGNYDKGTGFPAGDVTLNWETHQFSNDRGRRFTIDRMDNIESFELISARMVGEYLRDAVIPEVDAYRFSKIASASGVTAVEAALEAGSVKKAVDTAVTTLEEEEVDDSRLIIFATPTIAQILSEDIVRSTSNGDTVIENRINKYNGIPIVRVPQRRFYKGITLDPGSSSNAGGYSKTSSTGANINFIVMDRMASYNVTKLNVSKIFDPDTNQSKDAWQFDFRLYHDSFILENKVKGVYVHHKPAG